MTEHEIQSDILIAVTALPETCAWRANSGLLRTPDGQRTIRANLPGIADIQGCRRGRAFMIEVKTNTGRLRASQENFRKRWELAGGLYVVARSVGDALEALA